MVLKTELCRFSGAKIYPGKGIRFIRADPQVFIFANSKCKSYFHNRPRPVKLTWAWTATYRKQHKKDISAEAVKKRRRATKKNPNKNMSMVRGIHDCYDHYELKSYEKLFSCVGCKMSGFGPRYVCNLCGNELHRECRNPDATTTHEYFGRSTFVFQKTPSTKQCKIHNKEEFSKVCDACRKDIRGFSYHCEADKLDLHPCCRNLPRKLPIGGMTFKLSSSVSSKCGWCKKREVPNDGHQKKPGWSYVSSCEKYHFHVYCITEMVHEVYIKNDGDFLSLESFDLGRLVKAKKTSSRGSSVIKTIKSFIKIVLAALLGDPTALISSVSVELVARALQ